MKPLPALIALLLLSACIKTETIVVDQSVVLGQKVLISDDPYPPVLHAEGWQQPEPLPAPVSTAGAEDSPFIMPDGKTLYFFFTPDPSIPPEKQVIDGITGIFETTLTETGWSTPKRVVLQDKGKLSLDGCFFTDGSVAWFCSAREGYTGVNLFTARLKDGKWQDFTYAGDQLKGYEAGEMHLSSNGNELYFHSGRAGGKGGLDIWVTRRDGSAWSAPENIEAVNTPDNEGWPFLSQDGSELWLLRTVNGTPAIFRSVKQNGQWQAPELIVSQFAGEPSLDNAGNLYFVHHYYKDGKMLEADIYVAKKE
ncbi:MAG: hypothetical protein V1735_06620 [Nanoarchaeota archaeon]